MDISTYLQYKACANAQARRQCDVRDFLYLILTSKISLTRVSGLVQGLPLPNLRESLVPCLGPHGIDVVIHRYIFSRTYLIHKCNYYLDAYSYLPLVLLHFYLRSSTSLNSTTSSFSFSFLLFSSFFFSFSASRRCFPARSVSSLSCLLVEL
jgi:hypothetical protein